MSSQHRHPPRNFRPDPDREYVPAQEAVEGAGYTMSVALRAFLRWLIEDPSRLNQLRPHLDAVKAETPQGRPKGATRQ